MGWGRRLLLLALLVLQLGPSQQQQDGDAPAAGLEPWQDCVGTGAKLLKALNRTVTTYILLEGPTRFQPEDLLAYDLPIRIPAGKSVTLLPVQALLETNVLIDFGGVPQLLYLEGNASISFQDVELANVAQPSLGSGAAPVTEVKDSPLWSSITGDSMHQVILQHATVRYLRPSCIPEQTAATAGKLKAALGSAGSVTFTDDAISAVGRPFLMEYAVVDAATQAPLGVAAYNYTNITTVCQEEATLQPVAQAGAPAGSSEPSSGGSPPWLWAVVGTLAGLAVAGAAAAGLLFWRRRRVGAGAIEGTEVGKAPDVDLERGHSSSSSSDALGAAMYQARVGPISDLELGEMLGRGSFGSCYRGRWRGALVAVKVIETNIQAGKSYDLSREPLLSMSVSHPNCISTFKLSVVCVREAPPPAARADSIEGSASDEEGSNGSSTGTGISGGIGATGASLAKLKPGGGRAADSAGSLPMRGGPGGKDTQAEASPGAGPVAAAGGQRQQDVPGLRRDGGSQAWMVRVVSPHDVLTPGLYETWLVLEYADRGTLSEAVAAGRFKSSVSGELELGLAYLHDELNVIHGDLKGANVLLKSTRNDRRGFTAKLADWGLSRMLGRDETHVDATSFGTATHAAPELLQRQQLGKPADIYAFSIIMAEVLSGQEPFAGLTALQIIIQVSQHGARPPVPAACPPQLASLMQRCWHDDPQQRPVVSEVVRELREALRGCRQLMERAASAPSAAAMPAPERLGGA